MMGLDFKIPYVKKWRLFIEMEKTIVCFGDSNTHGYCSENGERFSSKERYPGVLKALLPDNFYIAEEGLSGRTTVFEDPLFESLSGLSAVNQCLLTHEPVDLLIIMLGTNDTKARFNATPYNIAQGLERIIKKAKSITDAWRNEPNILIIAPPPIEAEYINTDIADAMGSGCDKKSLELSRHYKTVAVRNGCHFLDAGAIEGIGMHPADFMHLNLQSHTLLANEVFKILPQILDFKN